MHCIVRVSVHLWTKEANINNNKEEPTYGVQKKEDREAKGEKEERSTRSGASPSFVHLSKLHILTRVPIA